MTIDELEAWIDLHAVDRDGHKIGTIADVYIDDATGQPEWLAIMTGLFGSRISFAPLVGAKEIAGEIALDYSKSQVKDSPNIEADGQLTEAEEAQLYAHYGLTQSSATNPMVQLTGEPPASMQEMQETGSTTVKAEVSAETARTRLRRRDAIAVDDLDFAGLHDDEVPPTPGSPSASSSGSNPSPKGA